MLFLTRTRSLLQAQFPTSDFPGFESHLTPLIPRLPRSRASGISPEFPNKALQCQALPRPLSCWVAASQSLLPRPGRDPSPEGAACFPENPWETPQFSLQSFFPFFFCPPRFQLFPSVSEGTTFLRNGGLRSCGAEGDGAEPETPRGWLPGGAK